MIQTRAVSDLWGKPVYTDDGVYFGECFDAVVQKNKVLGWKINAMPGSPLTKFLKGAKGVIVSHQLVKAVGDIMIISKVAIPQQSSQPSMGSHESAFIEEE